MEPTISSILLQTTCLLLLLIASTVNGRVTRTFNVDDFGGVPDGNTDSTQAFLNAWNAACATEGRPRVLVPEGTYLVGPVKFVGPCKGSMVMKVKGDVVAPTDLSVFPGSSWISFNYIDGLVIGGYGKFDGRGASAWPHNNCPKNWQCKLLPISLSFSFVKNAVIRGISSVDSKLFHMIIFASNNIKLRAVTITAPGDSPNTDGIHIAKSSDIDISGSTIGTGDDCVSIGDGCANISVSGVECGPGHGISIGSLGRNPKDEDVVGVTVSNCTLSGTQNGVRIKTWKDSAVLAVRDFLFQDIVMNDVNNPIIIDQEYCPYQQCSQQAPSRVKISNVKFSNIRGSSSSKVAVSLVCSQSFPCEGVQLDGINLYYNGEGAATSSCSNVVGTAFGTVVPPSCI